MLMDVDHLKSFVTVLLIVVKDKVRHTLHSRREKDTRRAVRTDEQSIITKGQQSQSRCEIRIPSMLKKCVRVGRATVEERVAMDFATVYCVGEPLLRFAEW